MSLWQLDRREEEQNRICGYETIAIIPWREDGSFDWIVDSGSGEIGQILDIFLRFSLQFKVMKFLTIQHKEEFKGHETGCHQFVVLKSASSTAQKYL